MARNAQRRENMLRDATALTPRVHLRAELGGESMEIFAGFRGEALSLYFGEDPVFHFNSLGELRRAYIDDQLVKAESRKLISFARVRTETESSLVPRELEADEEHAVLERAAGLLAEFRAAMTAGRFEIIGQEPASGGAPALVTEWLLLHPAPAAAASPHVR